MGGTQGKEGSLAEVHGASGGQIILRVAQYQLHCPGPSANESPQHQHLLHYGSSKLHFLLPQLNGRGCLLVEQSMDVLEKILEWLTPRELAVLKLTSRAMNLIVSQYLEHRLASGAARSNLSGFYERHEKLLLPREIELRKRLELNTKHELLLFSTMRQYAGEVRRVSLCHVDRFDFLDRRGGSVGGPGQDGTPPADGDDSRVVCERDVALRRAVVVVRNTPLLYFSHVFSDVKSGKYKVRLRTRLSNVKWEGWNDPNVKPAVLTVYKLPQGSHENSSPLPPDQLIRQNSVRRRQRKALSSLRIAPQQWHEIEFHQERPFSLCGGFDYDTLAFDCDSEWFFITLNEFVVDNSDKYGYERRDRPNPGTDLEFEFDDHSKPNRKRGIIFDFVELRRVGSIKSKWC